MNSIHDEDLGRLADLAAIVPAQSHAAVDRVRAYLIAQPARRRRVAPTVGAIAAALILAVSSLLFTTQAPSAKAQALAALKASANYQGWIHTRSVHTRNALSNRPDAIAWASQAPPPHDYYFNTSDRTRASTLTMSYASPKEEVWWQYDKDANEVRVSRFDPSAPGSGVPFSTDWLTIDGLLQHFTEHQREFSVTRRNDPEFDQYEIAMAMPDVPHQRRMTLSFDRESRLLRKALIIDPGSSVEMTYDYPRAGPASIYDLGVPRDARVVDTRLEAPEARLAAPEPTAIRAIFTLDEIRNAVAAVDASVSDLTVEFTWNATEPVDGLFDLHHETITCAGEKTSIRRTIGKNVLQHTRVISYNGSTTVICAFDPDKPQESPLPHPAMVFDKPPGEVPFQNSPYAFFCGAAAPGDKQTWFLNEILDDSARVKPYLELVSGRLCHVIDTNTGAFWIDTDRNYLVMRAIAKDGRDADRPRQETVIDAAAQIDKLWLPVRGRTWYKAWAGTPEETRALEVRKRPDGSWCLAVNQHPDDGTFELWRSLPPEIQLRRVDPATGSGDYVNRKDLH